MKARRGGQVSGQPSRRRLPFVAVWMLSFTIVAGPVALAPQPVGAQVTAQVTACNAAYLTFRDRVDPKLALAAIERRVRALKVASRALNQRCRIVFARSGYRIDIALPKVTSSVRRSIAASSVLQFRSVVGDVDPSSPTTSVLKADQEVLSSTGDNRSYVVGPVRLTGDIVAKSAAIVDPGSGQWTVEVELTKPASRIFDNLAREFFGKRLAIVVDAQVVAAPTVNARRFGGRFVISGNLTAGDAATMADVLQSSYPASLTFEGERVFR